MSEELQTSDKLQLLHEYVTFTIQTGYEILCDVVKNTGPNAHNLVKLMLEHGAKPEWKELYEAVKNTGPHAFEMVKLLVERGAEPDSDTLVHAAGNTGPCAFEITKFLVERGQICHGDFEVQLKLNRDVLCQAVNNTGPDTFEIVKFLIDEHGMKPDLWILSDAAENPGSYAFDMMKFLAERVENPNPQLRRQVDKVLHKVTENTGPHTFEILKFLINEQGMIPDDKSLRNAAWNNSPQALEMVKFLMERGLKPDSDTLHAAAGNNGPCALEMTRFLVEQGVKAESYTLFFAVENKSPCALEIVKLLMESGVEPNADTFCKIPTCALEMVNLLLEYGRRHLPEKNAYGHTVFEEALRNGNTAVMDYLFSRDDFCLSYFMPRRNEMSPAAYKEYREKAMPRVNELIDSKGLLYAKMVAADIEKILKNENPKPTKEDAKMLQPLAQKIASKDWVGEAQVSSNDFLGYEVER